MITYLKFKIFAALIAINFGVIWGFYEFIKNGNTYLLKLCFASFIFHLLLYYFFVKKEKAQPKP
jgi:hypothetical protein